MIIKSASELLTIMRLGGYELSVSDGVLHVWQARWIDDELAGLIRTHKTELIAILKREATA